MRSTHRPTAVLVAALVAALVSTGDVWAQAAPAASDEAADEAGSATEGAGEAEGVEEGAGDGIEPEGEIEVEAYEAGAPEPSPQGIEEIVVTAEKRTSVVQDTPIAITALTGGQLDQAGVGQIQDLAFQVPNLHYGVEFGLARVTIRGVSTALGSDASTSFHIDGIYQNNPALPASLTFFDIDRVEVLRGPQGTLYGRNATGGNINILSMPPSNEFEMFGDLELGTYDLKLGRAGLNLPVIEDKLAMRLSSYFEFRDGYQRNLLYPDRSVDRDDADAYAFRYQVRTTPTDTIDTTLRFNYAKLGGAGPATKLEGDFDRTFRFLQDAIDDLMLPETVLPPVYRNALPNPEDPRKINLNTIGSLDGEAWSTNGEFNWDFPEREMHFKLLGSFARSTRDSFADGDNSDIDLIDANLASGFDEWVAEANLVSTSDGPWEWTAGLFYYGTQGTFDVDAQARIEVVTFLPRVDIDYMQEYTFEEHGAAVFGQLRRTFGERWRVDAGLRYSHDWKQRSLFATEFQIPLNAVTSIPVFPEVFEDKSDDWGRFSGSLGVEYQLFDEQLLYGKFSTGYKSGTIGLPLIGVNDVTFPDNTEPEDIFAWELGAKTDWFDRRLRANLAGFFYLYNNLQVSQIVDAGVFIENASNARTLGLELEVTAVLFDHLLLVGNLGILDAKFTDYDCTPPEDPTTTIDCSGNNLIRAPRFSGTISAQYDLDMGRFGSLVPRIQVFASDEVFFRPFNEPEDRNGPYALLDLRLSWYSEDGRISVESYVDNVLDEDVITTKTVGSPLANSPVTTSFDRPRTAGVRIGLRW